MIEREATIRNGQGIHCRPSAVILKEVKGYEGEITIASGHGEARLESVMSLLGLGLDRGCRISIRVAGPEEEKMADKLVNLFEYDYDFPPRE